MTSNYLRIPYSNDHVEDRYKKVGLLDPHVSIDQFVSGLW